MFANPWERARKVYACCSEACARAFDPDVHWIPGNEPALAEADEDRRLLARARARLASGDRPTVVVREMLVAGVSPRGLRFALAEAETAAAARAKAIRRGALANILGMLIGRRAAVDDREVIDPAQLRAAVADLDSWSAKFRP